MSLRIHVGSGTVLLRPDWVNVDLPTDRCFLASERPDLVEAYATTEQHYYARHTEHKALDVLRTAGHRARTIGKVVKGTGVVQFSD